MTKEDISSLLIENLELVDKLHLSYATREDYEDGVRSTIVGYIFRESTVRRLLPQYVGFGYYLYADAMGTVREMVQTDNLSFIEHINGPFFIEHVDGT